jgi:hypothetical protein
LDVRVPAYAKKRLDALEATSIAQSPHHVEKVDVGLACTKIGKKSIDKRKVEPAAVEGKQKFKTVDNVFEFFEIFSIDEVVHLYAVVQPDYGNFMAVGSQAGSLNIDKGTTMGVVSVESPLLGGRKNVVKVKGLFPVFSGFLQPVCHELPSLPIPWPILQVHLKVVPGQDTLPPEIDLRPRTNVGKM